ncbi:MAG: hypothetical protein LBN36_07470 [Clostridiales Family XIII bacterium]|nr:hypothetical protein [Clostridiales Family XIII bacterium]
MILVEDGEIGLLLLLSIANIISLGLCIAAGHFEKMESDEPMLCNAVISSISPICILITGYVYFGTIFEINILIIVFGYIVYLVFCPANIIFVKRSIHKDRYSIMQGGATLKAFAALAFGGAVLVEILRIYLRHFANAEDPVTTYILMVIFVFFTYMNVFRAHRYMCYYYMKKYRDIRRIWDAAARREQAEYMRYR